MTHLMESMQVKDSICCWAPELRNYSDTQKKEYAKVKKIYAVLCKEHVVSAFDRKGEAESLAFKLNKCVEKLNRIEPGISFCIDDYLVRS